MQVSKASNWLFLKVVSLTAPLLMACQPLPQPPSAEMAEAIKQTCQESKGAYDWFIGQRLEDVRDYFPTGNHKFGTRIPGAIYTQEFILGRTLVYLDAERIIVRVRCG